MIQNLTFSPQDLIAAPPGGEAWPLRWIARVGLILLGLPKTIVFNFRYLPLRQAIRLPVLVSHRVAFLDFRGSVTLHGAARLGSVLLGFGNVGAFDYRRSRSVWQSDGHVVFEGPARLGNGFKLSVAGEVRFGPNFVLSAESQILCTDSITFGAGCLVSFNALIMDSDFHQIVVDAHAAGRVREPIYIGEHVWVGARATILKGVTLSDDVVVAAGAVVTRAEPRSGVVLGGNPAKVVRSGIRWDQ